MNKSTLFAILIGFLFCWKLIRMTGFGVMGVLWDIHIYMMALMVLYSLQFIFTKNISMFDIVFILYMIAISGSLIANGIIANQVFIVKFIMPAFVYIIAKNEGRYGISDPVLSKYSLIVSFVILFWAYIDFFSYNYLDLAIVDYDEVNILMGGTGRTFNGLLNHTIHPVLGLIYRTIGPAMTTHASGGLYASLAIYHLCEYRKHKGSIGKYNLFGFILYLLLVFSTMVGTAIMVFGVLFFFYVRAPLLKALSFVAAIGISAFALIGRGTRDPLRFLFFYGDSFDKFSLENLLFYIVFGEGNPNGTLLAGEIYLIALLFVVGIYGYILFWTLLAAFYYYCRKITRAGVDISSFFLLAVGIIAGSVHYNTTYMYPATLILFACYGFVSGRNDLIERYLNQSV
jgi:hypothetical protein